MCMSGKSSSTQAPAPAPATTFDYNAANRAQMAADQATQQRQAATVNSTTSGQTFGSELGGGTTQMAGG